MEIASSIGWAVEPARTGTRGVLHTKAWACLPWVAAAELRRRPRAVAPKHEPGGPYLDNLGDDGLGLALGLARDGRWIDSRVESLRRSRRASGSMTAKAPAVYTLPSETQRFGPPSYCKLGQSSATISHSPGEISEASSGGNGSRQRVLIVSPVKLSQGSMCPNPREACRKI